VTGAEYDLGRALGSRTCLVLLAGLILFAPQCAGTADATGFGAYQVHVEPADVFPGADRFGPVEGNPPAAAAYKGGTVIGYVFETSDIGYSGKPIKMLVGLDKNGVITGAKVIEHHEPILLVGIPQEKLFAFVGHYVGRSIIDLIGKGETKAVDAVSGATVTSVVINDSLSRSALAIAKSRGIAGFAPPAVAAAGSPQEGGAVPVIATVPFEPMDWAKLVGDGLIRRLHLSNDEVDEAFKKIGVGSPEPYAPAGEPNDEFIDLYLGLFSVETIGRSLLSEDNYRSFAGWINPGAAAVMIAANGAYSFRGSGFVRGGIFDRVQLVQNDKTYLFRDTFYRRIESFAVPGSPSFKEIGLFQLPPDSGFDPAQPFRLELLAQRPVGPIEKAFTSFTLPYELPAKFVTLQQPVAAAPQPAQPPEAAAPAAEQAGEPLWMKIWRSRAVDVAILALSLLVLTLIFFFQDWLVEHPVLFGRLRTSFLLFSILWLGLYAKAQLSVVNIFTFTNSLLTGFRWDFFLLEPLIFMLWCAVAVSLLFWGRGAYCGWLCPFGALQEVLNHTARRLGVRQYSVPFAWHERLWALKYILFLSLLGVSLGDLALAEQLSEVEPFKTVVLLHFMREAPFVIFALALLGAGLFIERFYCRYLCVLGAALAIPGRGRMFDWLKRRKQCGYECQLCAKNCMVQAIHPLGQINPNECLYCMHCQVIYWDDHVCPPLIMKRERRGKKSVAAPPASVFAATGASVNEPAKIDKEKANVEA
jgi:NosR/NirI family transcriptional regulator, nitrous oxide reductase regulator